MISFLEFNFAVRGLARLVRFDAGFSGFFDLSQQGARRSFWLALPILPIYLLLELLNANLPPDLDMSRLYAAEIIGYAVFWIAFPLTLLLGARLIDRGPRLFGVIVIYNWLSILGMGLALPVAIAQYLGLDAEIASLLQTAVFVFTLACEFYAFRRLLDVGIQIAGALVVIDFAEGQIVASLISLMAHGPLF